MHGPEDVAAVDDLHAIEGGDPAAEVPFDEGPACREERRPHVGANEGVTADEHAYGCRSEHRRTIGDRLGGEAGEELLEDL
jgi:hypothetical protein